MREYKKGQKMFPMFGCYTINPFGYCGFGMSPQMGFLLGFASATAIPPVGANPFGTSLFTNPFISRNLYNNNRPVQKNISVFQTASIMSGLGNFGSLTITGYTNVLQPTPATAYQLISMPSMPAVQYNYAATSDFEFPNVYNMAGNIANRIISNIQNGLTATQATQKQESSLPTESFSSSVSTSNSKISINEPQGGDLKPGLFKGRLAAQEALVSRICHKYGVSPALVASIIGLESGWGTSNLDMHNNFGGYRAAGDLGKNEKGFGYFSTIEKGLDAMIKNLAGYTRYGDVSQVNFNNLDSIGRHYCEGGQWAGKVREMYTSRVSSYLA